jgi:hypothetical protein
MTRVVKVSSYACQLLARAGITPPDNEGDVLDVNEVDKKLAGSGLSLNEKMACKSMLRDYRLLIPGRHVDTFKR